MYYVSNFVLCKNELRIRVYYYSHAKNMLTWGVTMFV